MVPKLAKKAPAVKLLWEKIRSREITDSHSPAKSWKSEPLFQKYKLPAFRTRLHVIRKEFALKVDGKFFSFFSIQLYFIVKPTGTSIEAEKNEDNLKRKCNVPKGLKRRTVSAKIQESNSEAS